MSRTIRLLDGALLTLLGVLLVDVVLESWLGLPKGIKNGLYVGLTLAAIVKISVGRAWRRFTTPADWALLGLFAVMVLAGAVGGSPVELIGEAVFVYLRGAVVFYAWRALDPPWQRVRPLLWVLGAVVAVQAVAALAQLVGGPAVTRWFGWSDLQWARTGRAQGLLEHPNHLGHVLALTLLGLLAWFVTRESVGWRWWLVFGAGALALAATQSRESLVAYGAAALLIGALRRGRWRPVLASILALALLSGAMLALRPSSRAELARRLNNVLAALRLPAGAETDEPRCIEGNENIEGCQELAPPREVRLLYAQQGAKLLLRRPVLGYGVGQFGGIVAQQHDPNWHLDPRFGPGGFELYRYRQTQQQVDSFWLHLVIEVGLLGLAVYLLWMVLLVRPFLQRLLRWRGPRWRGPPAHPVLYWAPAAWLVGMFVALLSPALEDPLFPPLMFSIIGWGWVMLVRTPVAERVEVASVH